MEAWVESAVEHVGQWPPALAYAVLALSAFLENVVPPVPGDLVVVLSAYLAGRGALEWLPVYIATCAGGTAGFATMYWIGRRQGRRFLLGRGRERVFSADHLERAEGWLARHGVWLILANRFLSGIRSVIALAAGTGGMGWRPLLLCGAVSMLLWNGALLYAGLSVGQNWELVTEWIGRYNRVVVSLLVLAAAGLALRRWWRRSRADGGQAQEE
jgi:membrane protein DedA with SNARE-associated domain